MKSKDNVINVPLGKIFGWGLFAFIAAILLTSAFYVVEAGDRGVLLTFGNPDTVAKEPGIGVKIPFAQKVVMMSVQTQRYDAAAAAASKDLQVVSSNLAVNYRLEPEVVPGVYRDLGLGYQDRVIAPALQEEVKAVTAKFTAEELISRRSDVKSLIEDGMRQRLATRGIVVESVNIVNFDFSEQFNAAIESKVTAEQQALKAQRDLERIQIEAMQAVAVAEGQRDAQIAKATGEAEAIRLIDEQLSKSPQYISYVQAQKWNGELPRFVGGGAVPLINLE